MKKINYYLFAIISCVVLVTSCGKNSSCYNNQNNYLIFSKDKDIIDEVGEVAQLKLSFITKDLKSDLKGDEAQFDSGDMLVEYSFVDIDTSKFEISNSSPGIIISKGNKPTKKDFAFIPKENGEHLITINYKAYNNENNKKEFESGSLSQLIIVKIPLWAKALDILEKKTLIFWTLLLGVLSTGILGFVRKKMNVKDNKDS